MSSEEGFTLPRRVESTRMMLEDGGNVDQGSDSAKGFREREREMLYPFLSLMTGSRTRFAPVSRERENPERSVRMKRDEMD